jgi:hypothetical protein
MTRHLQAASLDTALAGGKEAFFDWTVRLHNAVNKECGRIAYDPQVARLLYGRGYGCCRGRLFLWKCVAALAVIVCLLLLCRTAWKV